MTTTENVRMQSELRENFQICENAVEEVMEKTKNL